MRTVRSSPQDCRPGASITNVGGTMGTLGCFALTLDDHRPVLLTSEHVLFGAGAREQQPVYLLNAGLRHHVGRTRHGRRGLVRHDGYEVHVDCASAELAPEFADALQLAPRPPGADLKRDAQVSMLAAGSGSVQGIIADTEYQGPARIAGRDFQTRGQILVRPQCAGTAFSKNGDSGAALCDAAGTVVGVVWGATPLGEGLACPIGPVLWLLHIELAQPRSDGVAT